jgi:hypothetical protein
MTGIPTPHVEPSPSRNRTCTGFPDGVDGAVDGAAARPDAPDELAGSPFQVPPDEDPPQAADIASVVPSTTAVATDRHE